MLFMQVSYGVEIGDFAVICFCSCVVNALHKWRLPREHFNDKDTEMSNSMHF